MSRLTGDNFFDLIKIVIRDNKYKNVCNLNTPHAESQTENRDFFYKGVDWVDLYIKRPFSLKVLFRNIKNLKHLFLYFLETDLNRKRIRYYFYAIRKHEINYAFLTSISDISLVKEDIAKQKVYEDIESNDFYSEESELLDKITQLKKLKKEDVEKIKKIQDAFKETLEQITDQETLEHVERNCIHSYDGVYIYKNWQDWIVDSNKVPFDMPSGWSFEKLSEIVGLFLSSLLHHKISVKISND